MTPYRGIVQITCKATQCIAGPKLQEPAAGCVNCASAKVEILDLEDKVIETRKAKPAKQRKSTKTK